MEDDKISVLVHTIAGGIVGYVSTSFETLYAGLIGFVVLFILGGIVMNLGKEKKDFKWWLGNGLFVYIFTWMAVWVLFYNLVI